MIYSIEARSPFLDKDLFEFMNSVENNKKYKSNVSKIFLRNFLRDTGMKESASKMKKKGFSFPVAKLINSVLKDKIINSLKNSNKLINFIDQNIVDIYLDDHFRNKKNNYKKIWNLYVLNEWIANNL